MNRCLRTAFSPGFFLLWFIATLAVFPAWPGTTRAAAPLKRIILEGKVVAGANQTPVNRVWVGIRPKGGKNVWEGWTRADGSFRCSHPLLPGKYQIELRPENHVFKNTVIETDLPKLDPGEREDALLSAGRFMFGRSILEQPVNQVIVERVAAKTKKATETVTEVMAALVDAVNWFHQNETMILEIPMVEEVPLRTVTLRGSITGLLGRGRLRGGEVQFLWKGREIAYRPTGPNARFEIESVQLPIDKIKVIAGDRFGLFQRVEREFTVTSETTVAQLDDLVCGLRGWVKVVVGVLLAIVFWFTVRGRRIVPQTPVSEGAELTGGSDSRTTSPPLDIELWEQRLERAIEWLKTVWHRAWAGQAEVRENLVISTWFWVHGGLCLLLVVWAGLQLYGHTIRDSGPLGQGEAGAVSHAQQLRQANVWADRDVYKEFLQVPADFTPFQVFIWSCVLSVFPFHQTVWQGAHLFLFCASVLLVYLAAWVLSQRVFRSAAGGSAAGLCAGTLLLLCPGVLIYSCTLYPETVSLFLVSASLAAWCLVGVTPIRPTLTACSLLVGATFLFHPMHGLIILLVLATATTLRKGTDSQTVIDLGFLLLPGLAGVTILSRVFLPDTSKCVYAFLGRGEHLGWFGGLRWSFERLLADYSPYRGAMPAVLFLIIAVVWINPDRRVRGLAGGIVAGLLLIVFCRGKYWSSLLALIPVIVLFPALAVEAAIAHAETERRKPYALTTATLVFFLVPLIHQRLYQEPYYQASAEWNVVLEHLLPTVDMQRGALIIGENSQISPEAVNIALVERYEANPETIYRPSLQGRITPTGERIADATETQEEITRWLQNDLVGSVNTIELLPGHPLLKDARYLKEEGWSQTWVALMKDQPWYPETNTVVLEDQKTAIHVYRRDLEPCHIGRSRRIDSPQAGITRLALLDHAGRYTAHVERGRTMEVRARVANLLDSELRGSLWWVISDRFAKRPWERMWSETKQPVFLSPSDREEFTSTLVMPGEPGEYWLVVYLHGEDGTHLDAAFLADDIYVE